MTSHEVLRIRAHWIGKDNLFKPPFDRFFRWIGGIPINRSRSQNMVDRIIQVFRENKNLIIAIAPEGTRRKTPYWKTGFYHIAVGAQIPIVMGFIDYRTKSCGIGEVLYPTGDMEADMEKIRAFYSRFVGKFPDKMTLPFIKPLKAQGMYLRTIGSVPVSRNEDRQQDGNSASRSSSSDMRISPSFIRKIWNISDQKRARALRNARAAIFRDIGLFLGRIPLRRAPNEEINKCIKRKDRHGHPDNQDDGAGISPG